MPHLKRDSDNGHLLHGPNGHLVHDCDEGAGVCYLLSPCYCTCCRGGDCCYSSGAIITGDFLVPEASGLSKVINASYDWLAGYILQGGLMGELFEGVQLDLLGCAPSSHGTWWGGLISEYEWYFPDFFGEEKSGTWYLHVLVTKLVGTGWHVEFQLSADSDPSVGGVMAHESLATMPGTCCAADGDITDSNGSLFDSHDTDGTFDFVVSNNFCWGTEGDTPPCLRSLVDTCDGDDGLETVLPSVKVTNDLSAYVGDVISIDDGGGRLGYTVSVAPTCTDAITLSAGDIATIVEHVSCEAACEYIY